MTTAAPVWGGTTSPIPKKRAAYRSTMPCWAAISACWTARCAPKSSLEKVRITMKWDGLTAAERTTLRGAYDAKNDTTNTLSRPTRNRSA